MATEPSARGVDVGAARPGPLPLFDVAAAHRDVGDDLRRAFERVLASGDFASAHEVVRFEQSLAAFVDAEHAVGVASGTAALLLALLAAGVGPGDEVVVPANTFFATAEAVVATGATLVLADAQLETGSIDPASVAAHLTPRTAAVVAVHLYGVPADVDALGAVIAGTRAVLIEDAAQALGARWSGRPVGSLGRAAAFSFYPTKNLGALGEGGAVTTDDPDLARRVALLRNHGEIDKNVHVEMGFNERLDELQAAFLSVKLARLDDDRQRRQLATGRYRDALGGAEGVTLLSIPRRSDPAPHLFVVRVANRARVLRALRARGVTGAVHYPTPIHLQPACRGLRIRDGELANAEELARTVLSLPLFPGMTEAQIARCTEALVDAVEECP